MCVHPVKVAIPICRARPVLHGSEMMHTIDGVLVHRCVCMGGGGEGDTAFFLQIIHLAALVKNG